MTTPVTSAAPAATPAADPAATATPAPTTAPAAAAPSIPVSVTVEVNGGAASNELGHTDGDQATTGNVGVGVGLNVYPITSSSALDDFYTGVRVEGAYAFGGAPTAYTEVIKADGDSGGTDWHPNADDETQYNGITKDGMNNFDHFKLRIGVPIGYKIPNTGLKVELEGGLEVRGYTDKAKAVIAYDSVTPYGFSYMDSGAGAYAALTVRYTLPFLNNRLGVAVRGSHAGLNGSTTVPAYKPSGPYGYKDGVSNGLEGGIYYVIGQDGPVTEATVKTDKTTKLSKEEAQKIADAQLKAFMEVNGEALKAEGVTAVQIELTEVEELNKHKYPQLTANSDGTGSDTGWNYVLHLEYTTKGGNVFEDHYAVSDGTTARFGAFSDLKDYKKAE